MAKESLITSIKFICLRFFFANQQLCYKLSLILHCCRAKIILGPGIFLDSPPPPAPHLVAVASLFLRLVGPPALCWYSTDWELGSISSTFMPHSLGRKNGATSPSCISLARRPKPKWLLFKILILQPPSWEVCISTERDLVRANAMLIWSSQHMMIFILIREGEIIFFFFYRWSKFWVHFSIR